MNRRGFLAALASLLGVAAVPSLDWLKTEEPELYDDAWDGLPLAQFDKMSKAIVALYERDDAVFSMMMEHGRQFDVSNRSMRVPIKLR